VADSATILLDNGLLWVPASISCRRGKSAIDWKWTLTLRSYKTLAYLLYRLEHEVSVILALLAIIFRRYLFYITLINTVVEWHKMRSLELTRSLVGRLCHFGIEEIWFKVLSMWSGWGCTWQDVRSHALQILFFTIHTGPNPALNTLIFMVFITTIPNKLPTLFKVFAS